MQAGSAAKGRNRRYNVDQSSTLMIPSIVTISEAIFEAPSGTDFIFSGLRRSAVRHSLFARAGDSELRLAAKRALLFGSTIVHHHQGTTRLRKSGDRSGIGEKQWRMANGAWRKSGFHDRRNRHRYCGGLAHCAVHRALWTALSRARLHP